MSARGAAHADPSGCRVGQSRPATPPAPGRRIARALRGGHRGLICYFPLGDPALPPALAQIYVDEGVDVLELGFPVNRPYRDGPTVAASMRRARAAGAGAGRAFVESFELRARFPSQAMIWMMYPGAVAAPGVAESAREAGVDGLLYPASARRFPGVARRLAAVGLDFAHLLAWDADGRDVAATRDATAYVMIQARAGATGVRDAPLPDRRAAIARVRATGATAPVALGIGISNAQQVQAAMAMGADAVIVGSAVVEAALQGQDALRTLLRSLRRAVDRG